MEKEITAILRRASERGLPSLLIGANALIAFGYIRNTIDLDLLVPEHDRTRWLDLLGTLGYRLFNGSDAFAQFESAERTGTPVDLMFVDQSTWEKLTQGAPTLLPRPEYLVALKLHAASSPTRSKPELDREDIRQIIQTCGLDPEEDSFRALFCATVEKMHSTELKNSARTPLALDLNLPEFDRPLAAHRLPAMSWSDPCDTSRRRAPAT